MKADKDSADEEERRFSLTVDAKAPPLKNLTEFDRRDELEGWTKTSFIPLPDEYEEDDYNAQDLIINVGDAIIEGSLERANEDSDEGVGDQAEAEDIPVPLTLEEIIKEQRKK